MVKSKKAVRHRGSFMVETNNGGRIESVPGFDVGRVMRQGARSRVLPARLSAEQLGDAAWLEFAFPQAQVGVDDRVLITNTTVTPWRCICQLVMEGMHAEQVLGTGWMAGPHTVLTAGHNLVSHKTGRSPTRITVVPGRSGNFAPFDFFEAASFEVSPEWSASRSEEHDLGVIWLDKPVGERTGWFGFASRSNESLQRLIVNTSGYPADKRIGTQWFNSGRVDECRPKVLEYGLDTKSGQSGSPIFVLDKNDDRVVVAVHAYGDDDSNLGIRVNDEVFDLFSSWLK